MKKNNKYIFDLDNTLIYTDKLNNDSYNYALKNIGLPEINKIKRITRETVFKTYKNINTDEKSKLIQLKNEYFINNLHVTYMNELVVEVLRCQNKENCILWTSADEARVKALLEYYNINDLFKKILITNKIDISNDIEEICKLHKCDLQQLVFYEDNIMLVEKLGQLNLNVIGV